MRKLIKNSIRTPDGTILTSRNVHDYKCYKDKNGDTYTNDGGVEYLRRSVNVIPWEELSLYSDDPFEILEKILLGELMERIEMNLCTTNLYQIWVQIISTQYFHSTD